MIWRFQVRVVATPLFRHVISLGKEPPVSGYWSSGEVIALTAIHAVTFLTTCVLYRATATRPPAHCRRLVENMMFITSFVEIKECAAAPVAPPYRMLSAPSQSTVCASVHLYVCLSTQAARRRPIGKLCRCTVEAY